MKDDNEHSEWGVAAFPWEPKQHGTFCTLQLFDCCLISQCAKQYKIINTVYIKNFIREWQVEQLLW